MNLVQGVFPSTFGAENVLEFARLLRLRGWFGRIEGVLGCVFALDGVGDVVRLIRESVVQLRCHDASAG